MGLVVDQCQELLGRAGSKYACVLVTMYMIYHPNSEL